jgi:DNA-binding MarR family transcriptional regulator
MSAAAPEPEPTGLLDARLSSPGLLLALLGQAAMRRLRAAHDAYGLNPRQFQLLGLLHDNGSLGQRDLSAAMAIDPSILVTLLNPLEADGLVVRTRSATDRRRHDVTLTDAGRARLTDSLAGQLAAEDEIFSALTPAQRVQLRDLLLRLTDAGRLPRADARGTG